MEHHQPRILFVDDNPAVLAGLRGLLRSRRKRWDMVFVNSGTEAVERLAKDPYDLIVTDMRMPGMDGYTLLEHVKLEHPGTARAVLSGHVEPKAVARSLSIAHEFLAKPCPADMLRCVIERILRVREVAKHGVIRSMVGGIDVLPSPPQTCRELLDLFHQRQSGIAEVAKIVERDPAISAKVLQVANSAYFAARFNVSGIRPAVELLGADTIRDLVVGLYVTHGAAKILGRVKGFSLVAEQDHALCVAKLAREFLKSGPESDAAFLGGLLHDVGKLVLAAREPQQFAEALATHNNEEIPLHEAERKVLGFTHAEVGAYLLRLWGLPHSVVAVVLAHHEPGPMARTTFDAVTAVHLANGLVTSEDPASYVADDAVQRALDKHRASGELDRWTRRALTLRECGEAKTFDGNKMAG